MMLRFLKPWSIMRKICQLLLLAKGFVSGLKVGHIQGALNSWICQPSVMKCKLLNLRCIPCDCKPFQYSYDCSCRNVFSVREIIKLQGFCNCDMKDFLSQNLDLMLRGGESLLIVGHSGCGKSSLLRAISGESNFLCIIFNCICD